MKPLFQNTRPQQNNIVLDPPLSGVEDREATTKEKNIKYYKEKKERGHLGGI